MHDENAPLREDSPKVSVPATARDFLANERTFLAYMRTALAFLGFGFVIARFSLLSREYENGASLTQGVHLSVTLGVVMAIAGVFVGAFGTKRYVDTDTALRRSEVLALPPSAAMFVAGSIALLGAFVAVALFRMR